MSVRCYLNRNPIVSRAIFTVLLFAAALFVTVPKASADDCQRRIAKADHRVHEAVEHHGWRSQEADHARHELAEARAYCWDHRHRWWDEDAHRWHTEHDWDDHDHDHDREEHH
jgi:hypothetical protein